MHDRALPSHGGPGEHAVEKIVPDPCVEQTLEGTDEIMRVIVARGLTEASG